MTRFWVGAAAPERPGVRRRRALPALGLALSAPYLAFLLLPLVAVLLRADLANLWAHLNHPAVGQATWLSLSTSLVTTLLAVTVGTPVAWLLARSDFPLKRAVDTLVDLPTVLPPAVAGLALLLAFGRRGLLGGVLEAAGIRLAFTTAAVVLAQTFIAAPLYIRAAMVGFGGVEPELEQAAAMDGANHLDVFRLITLPLAGTALLTGALLAFARALGEFGATIVFAGNFPGRTQTMPLAIYLGLEANLEVAITLSLLLMALSFLAIFALRRLLQRAGE